MRARIVDWSLLLLTLMGAGSGLWTFLVGEPGGRWFFVAHGVMGLAVLGVLAAKLRRVTPVVMARKGRRVSALIGINTALVALATVAIGVAWVVAQRPVAYPNGMILHTTAALVLVALCVWHFLLRYRPLTVRDLRDRRSALRFLGMVAGGGLAWAALEGAQHVWGTAGSRRRFTGSRRADGTLPVTMWMFDNPPPLNPVAYRLEVSGAVAQPQVLTLDELARLPQQSMTATLDCTGGWYSEQIWHGIRVADLLARAQPEGGARAVRFRAVTGYRWSLPLAEAAGLLLALQVGGVSLDHGHGAPLRLVAPGRRGFQWVKWLVAVEVLDAPDIGQWGAIFTSGLDGK